MKKTFTLRLILIALFTAMSMTVNAEVIQYTTDDGFQYSLDTDTKTAQLTKYRGSATDVVIPETVTHNGVTYSVTSLGDWCFDSCRSLTSIDIPSSVTTLGGRCFSGCTSLTSIEIPSSVTSMGNYCFDNCSHLTFIDIPSSVTSLGKSCFEKCTSLTSITIPSSVTSLGDWCFYDCTSLTSISIPSSVTSLGESCFSGCTSLTSISIPSSVTSLGASCFSGCTSLTSISIPSSVTTLGGRCFSYCTSLTSITIPSSVTSLGDGCFYNCNSLKSINIPSSVTSLGESCFSDCTSLTSIDIPSSVTYIGSSCFSGCSLESIHVDENNTVYDSRGNCNAIIETKSNSMIVGCKTTIIPSSVTSLGDWCFYDCTSLTSITIPSSVTSLGESCFSGCTSLTSIDIPESVTSLGDYCFSDCTSLTSITIPSSVTSLGDGCFYGCTSLTSITIPSSVTSLGNNCFGLCSSLKTVTCEIPTAISGDFFFSTHIGQATLIVPKASLDSYRTTSPWSGFMTIIAAEKSYITDDGFVFSLDSEAKNAELIAYAGSANSIVIPEIVTNNGVTYSVNSIGAYCFYKCTSLTSVSIPSSVTSLGDYCFKTPCYIKTVTCEIPTAISGDFFFSTYIGQATLIVPEASLESYRTTSPWSGFMTIIAAEKSYITDDGFVFSLDSEAKNAELISYAGSANSISIPEVVTNNGVTYSVNSIGGCCFYNCTSLTSIDIPSSVKSLSDYCFYGCSSLTSIDIPSSVTSLGDWCFASCRSLTSIDIPESVTSLGDWCFASCTSLTSIDIPESVTSLGDYCFYFCGSLTSIEIPSSVTSMGGRCFADCNSIKTVTCEIPTAISGDFFVDTPIEEATLYVHEASLVSYRKTSTWNNFGTIKVIKGEDGDNTPYDVFVYDFDNESMNATLSAYAGSSNNIVIPESVTHNGETYSVTSLGDYCFYNCKSLTSISIPSSVTNFGDHCFYNCTSLTSVSIPSSVTSLGESCFNNCTSLTSIDIPKSVTSLGASCFSGCTSLTSVSIPSSVTSLGASCFSGCTSLTSVSIPSSVTSLGESCFNNCTSLTSIDIPKSVTSLGASCFSGCTSLTSIDIPSSMTSLGRYCFASCPSLETMTCRIKNAKSGDFFGTTPIDQATLYVRLASLESYKSTSPWSGFGTIEVINGDDGFEYSYDIETKNATLISYGGSAKSIVIPESVTHDGVTYSVTSVGDGCFSDCTSITSIDIPSSVTSLGSSCFENCTSLTSIDIPSSVTSLEASCFSGCTSLTSIEIPSSVTSLGAACFSGCTSLTSIDIPSSVTSLGAACVLGCTSLTSIDIPSSVTSLGDYCFYNCTSLTSIDIPSSVTSLGDYCFYNCTSLTSITIPSSVTSLGDYCFLCCTSLTSISIPSSVTSLGNYCFGGCNYSLKEVTCEIPTAIEGNFFDGTAQFILRVPEASLESYRTTADWSNFMTIIAIEKSYITDDGFEFSLDSEAKSAELISYTGSANSISIPEVVTYNDVRYSVTSLRDYCFFACASLTSVSIPSSVTSLGEGCFAFCTSLTSISIPSSVTSLGEVCFAGCTSIKTVTCEIPTAIPGDFFDSTTIGKATLFVPEASLESYRTTSPWSGFMTIIAAEKSYITDDGFVFSLDSETKNAELIAYTAFANSISIPEIVTNNGVTYSVNSIGAYCFYNCTSLTSIEIPSSVTSMGESCFAGCDSIKTVTCEIPTAISGDFFVDTPIDQATLFVPEASLESYRTTADWSGFGTILGFSSSFEVTSNNPEDWNDLSKPHSFSVHGTYENEAGLDGYIDYDVEDKGNWTALTETLSPGSEFSASLVATFDTTKTTHTIRFRSRDLEGNTKMLRSVEYIDVSFHAVTGIEDKSYTGDSIYQTKLTCDLPAEQYRLCAYTNNVNAGTATFNIEGVFPKTIGCKTYSFAIKPQPLDGEITFDETEYEYSGESLHPSWKFSNEAYANLELGKDFSVAWENNTAPGTATLIVTGKNNYTGTLTGTFNIIKAQLSDICYTITLPDEEITYDGESHGASVVTSEGVGEATIYYQKEGETELTTTQPVEAGDYTIYISFAESSFYYGKERTQVGTFSIYQLSEEEWRILQSVLAELQAMGWSQSFDISQGVKIVPTLKGFTIEKGHVTGIDLSRQNLTGMFPYSILALPKLQRVDLSGNNLIGDIGEATNEFVMENPDINANVKELNISGNRLSGNIGVFANCLAGLTSLNASDNSLEEVNPMIPTTVTNLDISKQTIGRVVPVQISDLSVDSIASKVPEILLYDHDNQTFTPNINMLCSTLDNNWRIMVSSQDWTLTVTNVSENKVYYGENGDTLNVAVVDIDGANEGSTFRISLTFDDGDGNFDGNVDILDLQTTLNYMFEEYLDKSYNYTASNLVKDDIINVQDAVCLVNKLLDSSTSLSAKQYSSPNRAEAFSLESNATVLIEGGLLKIKSDIPVSAFDIIVSTMDDVKQLSALNDMGFTCAYRQDGNLLHLIGYSLTGSVLPIGETTICELENGVVTYTMLSDAYANEIKTEINSTPTSIQSHYNNDKQSEVYRMPIGARRAISFDKNGRKTIIKDEK